MPLNSEVEKLKSNQNNLQFLIERLTTNQQSMYFLDFVMIAAVKRTLNLGYGLTNLLETRNMMCCRALVRMQIDTVSRLLAYTYVKDPEQMAKEIVNGKKLKKLKSASGESLSDFFLINKMSHTYPWVQTVYDLTCNDVHFTEKQFYDSILTADSQKIVLSISHKDEKFPESSWLEIIRCFSQLNDILYELIESYIDSKN